MITREEAIEIARAHAETRGWPWRGAVKVTAERTFILFGRRTFRVTSNADMLGGNVFVTIAADTGEILHAGYGPR